MVGWDVRGEGGMMSRAEQKKEQQQQHVRYTSAKRRLHQQIRTGLSGCCWCGQEAAACRSAHLATCIDMHVLLWLQTAFKCVIGLIRVAILGSKGLLVRQLLHQQVCCSAVEQQQAYGQASTAGLQHLMNVYHFTWDELS